MFSKNWLLTRHIKKFHQFCEEKTAYEKTNEENHVYEKTNEEHHVHEKIKIERNAFVKLEKKILLLNSWIYA